MNIKSFALGFITGVVITIAGVVLLAAYVASLDNSSNTISDIPESAFAECPKDGDANITGLLEPIRKKNKVPAICAAVVTSDGLKAVGAVGVRKIQTNIPVTIGDKWHLGSDTKAITASLIGRLVEQGAVQWTSSLADIFPELAPTMNPELRDVTLLELLSHRAGLAENLNWQAFSKKGSLQEQRYLAVKEAVGNKPKYKVGSYNYSNLGYVIAGTFVEKVTNSSWEEQIKELIFDPLKIITAGFGGTGTPGQVDQPWGHNDDGTPVSENGHTMDNPLLMAPAGCVNCTITDWSKFIVDQLKGATGKQGILKPETYKVIHAPPFGGDYSLGWLVLQRDWGGGTVFHHGGSNTMNFANVWIAPNRDFAVLVCVNQGGNSAFKASDEAVGAMIDFYLRRK